MLAQIDKLNNDLEGLSERIFSITGIVLNCPFQEEIEKLKNFVNQLPPKEKDPDSPKWQLEHNLIYHEKPDFPVTTEQAQYISEQFSLLRSPASDEIFMKQLESYEGDYIPHTNLKKENDFAVSLSLAYTNYLPQELKKLEKIRKNIFKKTGIAFLIPTEGDIKFLRKSNGIQLTKQEKLEGLEYTRLIEIFEQRTEGIIALLAKERMAELEKEKASEPEQQKKSFVEREEERNNKDNNLPPL